MADRRRESAAVGATEHPTHLLIPIGGNPAREFVAIHAGDPPANKHRDPQRKMVTVVKGRFTIGFGQTRPCAVDTWSGSTSKPPHIISTKTDGLSRDAASTALAQMLAQIWLSA
jgi:hypothetical protein